MDLTNFFASICGARVQTIFRLAGYPEPVADLLGAICTNAVPRSVFETKANFGRETLDRFSAAYSRPHLPQGAPTSPYLANLCAFRADCRLTGLAKAAGADYTRYADDLAFSFNSKIERHADHFAVRATAILLEEGFAVNHRKTRIMPQSTRQHLAGVVVNDRQNVRRADFDVLKATLMNCVRHGPESQNRAAHPAFRSHLEGRIAFVEMVNATKGSRLRSIFEKIYW